MAEPCILPLGIAPRGKRALRFGFLLCDLSAQPCCDLGHANRAHHGQGRVQIAGKKAFDFRDRPMLQHQAKAPVASFVKPRAVGQQDRCGQVDPVPDPALQPCLPVAKRLAGRAHHFQRAGDARGVGRGKAGGGLRVFT